MDDCRFDHWTRMLGALQDRRVAVKEMTAAGAALVALAKAELGFAQEGDVLAEACGLTGDSCRRDSQCCSNDCNRRRRRRNGGGNRRRRNRDGECRCAGEGRSCTRDAGCCRGRCNSNRECRCITRGNICNRAEDCCGNDVCRNGFCNN